MFGGAPDAAKKAEAVAGYFANYEIHKSHSLGIDRDQAKSQGVRIEDLETDQELQDAVLSVHHATMHTLNGAAVKIVENNLGRAYAKLAQQFVFQMPMMGPGPVGPIPPGVPGAGPVGVPAPPSGGQP